MIAVGYGWNSPTPPGRSKLQCAGPVSQLDRLMIVTGGEEQNISIATVVSKRLFAGDWEYLIDDAIFTSPPRLDHSGAALINKEGELVGIGSLFVLDALNAPFVLLLSCLTLAIVAGASNVLLGVAKLRSLFLLESLLLLTLTAADELLLALAY